MDNQNRLFVGNLSYQTMENDLQDHFAAAGVVLNVNLMLDKFTGRSRGFAFVELATAEEAQRAVDLLHGKELGGRPLTVNIARPREERPPREGGGGGGGFRGGGGGGGGGGYRGGGGGGGGYRGGGGGGGGWRGGGGGERRERGGGGGGGGWRGGREDRNSGGDRY